MSNGQKQRTSLARALAASPKLLLLDDPLRNVDAKLRFEMRLELPRLLRQSGSAVLYVTQDYKEAMALADRIAVLRDGRFEQVATPEEIYDTPRSIAVARLFGDPAINVAESRIGRPGMPRWARCAGALSTRSRLSPDAGARALGIRRRRWWHTGSQRPARLRYVEAVPAQERPPAVKHERLGVSCPLHVGRRSRRRARSR